MARSGRLVNPMTLVWISGVVVGSVTFLGGALNLGIALARWTGSDVAMALFFPASLILGVWGWMGVLAGVWRVRRAYLQRVGSEVSAVVVESDLECERGRRLFNFDSWRLQIEAQFPHPDSGAEVQVRKQFLYHQFRVSKARAMSERLSIGAPVPLVVHKKSALIDVPKRPLWIDIW
ncbi:hypothetical protein [Nocardia salmonicida]|uniref:hypothetical protein n=1 Tax=Nocardia salmonicida TaxID=53431 RepID=UPI0034459C0A